MEKSLVKLFLAVAIASFGLTSARAEEWKPANGPLMTRWSKDVSPDKPLPEYPRPQLVRKQWINLNGLWDLAVTPKESPQPQFSQKKILVPYPIESALSGVMKRVSEKERIWYRRTFEVPRTWLGKRLMLNFGAVDFEATVFVNGKEAGKHRGGYDAFTFDITEYVKPKGENEIVVSVWDPTDAGTQPRGKQIRNPHGIWYTPTSGIWQTVWIEPVSAAYIKNLEITPDIDKGTVRVRPIATTAIGQFNVEATVLDRSGKVAETSALLGKDLNISIEKPKLWSPERPHLYRLVVSLKIGSRTIDRVESYFGMRKISLGRDANGFTRMMLNNKPYFQFGPLDQGFWPDGIYTAPTDKALRYDIVMTKKFGFNMARKHVKIEPQRWYYWCDRLGLLVWQDMPSGDKYIGPKDPDVQRTPESAAQFEMELEAMVKGFYNHPCIVMWVPFNEGWGQYDTARITQMIKKLDPTRLVNNTSGWTDRGVGDVNDMHSYPGPDAPAPETTRAIVLGEFGGLGLPVKGHTWQEEKNWGYRSFTNTASLTQAYLNLLSKLFPLIEEKGLSAAVYTQTTDVEIEVNGLMTYDREVNKMDPKVLAPANRGKVPAKGAIKELVPTARTGQPLWRYTTEQPATNWMLPGFDASAWKQGSAGFGTAETPGTVARTIWNSDRIWLRREFSIPSTKGDLKLRMHHDEDADVYINGVLAARAEGYTTDYEEFEMTKEARAAFRPSGNIIAVHCRQTAGGQYIDAGIVSASE